jgi:hypothetical protein
MALKLLMCVLATLVLPSICHQRVFGQAPQNSKTIDHTCLFFNSIGTRLDCYFTVEEMMAPNARMSNLFGKSIDRIDEVSTVEQLVKLLTDQLPGFRIEVNSPDSAIVRIADKRLFSLKDYVLEKRTDIKCDGTIDDMIAVLGNKIGNIHTPTKNPIIRGVWFSDPITKVAINASEEKVRDILTDFVPLHRYNRFLWHAETVQDRQGLADTSVAFKGPMNERTLAYLVSQQKKPVDFSSGQLAFFDKSSEGDRQVIEEAVGFIDRQMKEKKHRQVRWAMFFLGKEKAEKGIPVLVQYIDYRYTKSKVVEESFPALRALVQIGRPASIVAYSLMEGETDPERLELLFLVVLGVEGPEQTRREMNRLITKLVGNAEQEKRVDNLVRKWL